MNIYLVRRTDYAGWDQYCGLVCVARTEEEAKSLNPGSGEGAEDWVTKDLMSVTILGKAEEKYCYPRIILTDFKRG